MRRLCQNCKKQYTPSPDVMRALGIAETDAAAIPFFKAVGCEQCRHTGYRGRVGIYEVMRVTDKVRRLVTQRASEDAIREAAQQGGMLSLGEDALAKVKAGLTTPDEVLRVVTEVREMRGVCPGCGGAVALDFVACPSCGQRVSGACPGCGRSLQPGWTFCPYCTRSTARPQTRVQRRRTPEPMPNVAAFKKALPG